MEKFFGQTYIYYFGFLFPFVTGYVGETHFSDLSVMLYGIVLFMAGFAYFILVKALISRHGKESKIAQAIGKDIKGLISIVIYAIAICLSFYNSIIAFALYVIVACIWFIPDKRIEHIIND